MMNYFEKSEHIKYLSCCFVLYYEHDILEGMHAFVSYYFSSSNPFLDEKGALQLCKILKGRGMLETYSEAGFYMLEQSRYTEAFDCFAQGGNNPASMYALSCMLENVDGFENLDVEKHLPLEVGCSYRQRAFEMKNAIVKNQEALHIPTILTLAVQHETGIAGVVKSDLKRAMLLYNQAYTKGNSFIACICLINLEYKINDKMCEEKNFPFGDYNFYEKLERVHYAIREFNRTHYNKDKSNVPCELPTVISPEARAHLEVHHLRLFMKILDRYEELLNNTYIQERVIQECVNRFASMKHSIRTMRHCVATNVLNSDISLPCYVNKARKEFVQWRENWRNSDDCPICFRNIQNDLKVYSSNCRHYICRECAKRFEKLSKEKRLCCQCRSAWLPVEKSTHVHKCRQALAPSMQ